MRIAWVVVVATGVLLGCGPVVVPSVVDAGLGGGTATGGGSGGGGGTTTGGGDGTGGGGAQPVCPTLNCAEACVEPTGCVPYFTGIEIVSPDAGARVPEGTVLFVARMVETVGVTVTDDKYPATLQYASDDGGARTLLKVADENRYTTNLNFNSCGQSRVFSATTSLEDGGFSVASAITCDGQAPTVTLPTMTNYFQRDDVTLLQLTTSEPLSTATATLGGVALDSADAGCSDAGPCFIMDFSKPNFPYIDAGVQLTVTASDVAGLPAVIAPQTLKVTRIRRQWDVVDAVVAAPAVTKSGSVVVGTRRNTRAGTLFHLDSVTSEGLDAGVPIGAVEGIAISEAATTSGAIAPDGQYAFVSYNADNGGVPQGTLSGFALPSLAAVAKPKCTANDSQSTYQAPGLLHVGSYRVSAVGVSNGTASEPARLFYWDSVSGGTTKNVGNLHTKSESPPLNALVFDAATPTSYVHYLGVTGLADAQCVLQKITGIRTSPDPTLDPASFVFDGGGCNHQSLGPDGNGKASYVSDVTPIDLVVPFDPSEVVRANTAGASGNWSFGTDEKRGAIVFESSTVAYMGSGERLARFDPSSSNPTLTPIVPSAGQDFSLAPVLLEAQTPQVPGWIYAVTRSGQVVGFDRSPSGGGSSWKAFPRASATVNAHPGFGPNVRPGAASGTGILYIGYSDGIVVALIVDGARLHGTWPKYQRSMGNAGNDDETYFPTNWNP